MLKCILYSLACTLFLGCANANLKSPTASVKGVALKNIDASGFTLDFNVDVTNPNDIALPLKGVDYKLDLAGVEVLKGNAIPDGAIPASGTKTIALPVTLTYQNLLAAKSGLAKSRGNIPYKLTSGVTVSTGVPLFGNHRTPLNYEGTFALKDILNNPEFVNRVPMEYKVPLQLLGGFFTQ